MAKRRTIHTETVILRMPSALKDALAVNAEKQGASQADILRVALEMYLQDYDERVETAGTLQPMYMTDIEKEAGL